MLNTVAQKYPHLDLCSIAIAKLYQGNTISSKIPVV